VAVDIVRMVIDGIEIPIDENHHYYILLPIPEGGETLNLDLHRADGSVIRKQVQIGSLSGGSG
jgi:hypothetical protein